VREQAGISVNHKSFNQTAIVANFITEKPHANVARQWFAPHETLALLPLPQQMVSMVWSVSTQKATQLLELSADELAQSVLEQSQGVLGKLTLQGKPQQFALNQSTASRLIADRVVLLGDAAHQIHPMAGQGVNLGFRDVMQLQQLTANAHSMMDIGDSSLLRQFERARLADIASMNTLTSGLDALFASENSWLNSLTDWGFKQLNTQATIKKLLIQQAAA
jgi:ubiquinone biosynthesis UbiH/UbiF/VisC/COQ6 family hydroxylase